MLDRIETCQQITSDLRGTIGTLSGLSADIGLYPELCAGERPLTPLLEDLRTHIGSVFATMTSR